MNKQTTMNAGILLYCIMLHKIEIFLLYTLYKEACLRSRDQIYTTCSKYEPGPKK